MNDPTSMRLAAASISAVERDTGLSKDTLRVWERRYGFPLPARDAFGERAYPVEQVEKLRVVKRLLDNGHRPGRVVPLGVEELLRLSDGISGTVQRPPASKDIDLDAYLDLLKAHDLRGLRRALGQAMLRLGLARFVTELAAPLATLVGDNWMRGQIQVFEEHLFAETLGTLLRTSLAGLPEPAGDAAPVVLMTTFPQESHGLGLLMAEVMLALEGCACISLGTQTPVREIATAALACRADVVALSFSAGINANQAAHGLAELRLALPGTAIWAGGRSAALHRKDLAGVEAIGELDRLPAAVARFRNTRAGGGR